MTPLDTAIAICGTQTELARRVTGKPASGYVYHWRNNGVSETVAIAIERAQLAAVAESPEAAARADALGGIATVEALRPDREWVRTADGHIVEYRVPVDRPEDFGLEPDAVHRQPAAENAGDAAQAAETSVLRVA